MLLPLSQLPLVAVAVAAVAVVRGSSKILAKKTVARSVRFVRSTRAVHVNG